MSQKADALVASNCFRRQKICRGFLEEVLQNVRVYSGAYHRRKIVEREFRPEEIIRRCLVTRQNVNFWTFSVFRNVRRQSCWLLCRNSGQPLGDTRPLGGETQIYSRG